MIRGWGQPLTPSGRRRCATVSKLALRVCRTGGFVHTFLSANRKGPEAGPFLLAGRESASSPLMRRRTHGEWIFRHSSQPSALGVSVRIDLRACMRRPLGCSATGDVGSDDWIDLMHLATFLIRYPSQDATSTRHTAQTGRGNEGQSRSERHARTQVGQGDCRREWNGITTALLDLFDSLMPCCTRPILANRSTKGTRLVDIETPRSASLD